jgi:hypothetical protein
MGDKKKLERRIDLPDVKGSERIKYFLKICRHKQQYYLAQEGEDEGKFLQTLFY